MKQWAHTATATEDRNGDFYCWDCFDLTGDIDLAFEHCAEFFDREGQPRHGTTPQTEPVAAHPKRAERDTPPDLVAWWLAKYGREVQQVEAAKASKQAADRRMKQWFEDTRRPLLRSAAWWQSLIDGYCWDQLRAECGDRDMTDPKVWKHLTKRFKFPTGYVQFRRVSEQFTVTNPSEWGAWVLGQAGQGAALTAMWQGLSTWFGEDASTLVSLSIPAPKWGDPRFSGRVRGDGSPCVITVGPDEEETGEIVPGLSWERAAIVLNKPHPEDVEHPAWSPPPEGWDLTEPPDDWQPDNGGDVDLFD